MGGCTWRPTVSQSPDWFLHLSPVSLEVDYLQFLLRVVVEEMAFHHLKYQSSMMIQMKNLRDLAYRQLFWVLYRVQASNWFVMILSPIPLPAVQAPLPSL